MQNNDFSVRPGSLKGSSAGVFKQFLFENIFICRIGVIKSFDVETQTRVLLLLKSTKG
ncbi:DUF777 family protein (plasmid) [Borreliella andersonii]|uniref:DUF777 family protein n=1 Tax=Borrelia andersonii TaxID=42109 RepID=A0ABZ0CGG8_BORAD|nr:DUF777 family protein [Borreliella andersonii]WNY66374.1 DUF777 family protein [Borreliella andersonii]